MVPVSFLQVMVKTYSLMAVRLPLLWVPPLVLFAPLQSPLAVHDEGEFSVVQLSVTLLPGRTGPVGALLRNTIGLPGGTAWTVSFALIVWLVPLAFLQLSV
jgi:hypothetical protein